MFWINAGEVLGSDDTLLTGALLEQEGGEVAYQVSVRSQSEAAEAEGFWEESIRLFPLRSDMRYTYCAYAQIGPALQRSGIPLQDAPFYLRAPQPEDREESDRHERWKRIVLLEKDLRAHPDDPLVLFHLGRLYGEEQEQNLAAYYLQCSLRETDPYAPFTRHVYTLLTEAQMALGDWEAALKTNEAGRMHFSDETQFLLQAGKIYVQFDQFTEARQALEVLAVEPMGREEKEGRARLWRVQGRHELALLYRRMGDSTACVRALRDILVMYPDYVPARIDLVETLYHLRRDHEARAVIAEGGRLSQGR